MTISTELAKLMMNISGYYESESMKKAIHHSIYDNKPMIDDVFRSGMYLEKLSYTVHTLPLMKEVEELIATILNRKTE